MSFPLSARAYRGAHVTDATSPPSSPTAFVNVYPEFPQEALNGSTLLVKNTFLEMRRSSADSNLGSSRNRAKSSPFLFSECNRDSFPETLVDARRRLLTFDCGPGDNEVVTEGKSPRSCGTGSTATPASSAPPPPTTVMLKNLPEEYSREMLMDTLSSRGFSGLFDFVYAPMDFGKRSTFGYVFINFVTPEAADLFLLHFQDFNDWSVPSDRYADVDWSDRQGLEGLIDRYRNSPLMHSSVPDEAKPIMLKNGARVDFPAPTQAVKPLRVRQSKARKARNLGHIEIGD